MMKVTPKKDKRFNGAGFTGMLVKGMPIEVSDNLGEHLIQNGLAEKSKIEQSKTVEVKTDAQAN
jgi:hypothetical protein